MFHSRATNLRSSNRAFSTSFTSAPAPFSLSFSTRERRMFAFRPSAGVSLQSRTLNPFSFSRGKSRGKLASKDLFSPSRFHRAPQPSLVRLGSPLVYPASLDTIKGPRLVSDGNLRARFILPSLNNSIFKDRSRETSPDGRLKRLVNLGYSKRISDIHRVLISRSRVRLENIPSFESFVHRTKIVVRRNTAE